MRSRLLVSVLASGAMVLTSFILAPGAAQAATYTSTGLRCTKVGTAGADRIVGTSGNDVICGLGGNDVIYAGAGNDYVDGGSGGDIIYGGTGNDRLAGGSGGDRLYGEDGADILSGQADGDTLYGGAGNDTIAGSTGGDRLDGGEGNDRLFGGPDGDIVSGGGGTDAVNGDSGNDDLSGGAGADTLSGGSGTNWCEFSSIDIRYSCKVDVEKPRAVAVALSPSSVDVTNGSKDVVAKVHVVDDTGVRSVQVGAQYPESPGSADGGVALLSSGSIRDGWWSVTLRVPRYIAGGKMTVMTDLRDRVGRTDFVEFPAALSVASRSADLLPPVVRSLTLNASSFDVRSAARTVTATVRITDDTSGVGSSAYLCPFRPANGGFVQLGCQDLVRVSGTNRDGLWRASHVLAKGEVGGSWNFAVWVDDASRMHDLQYYNGPDLYALNERQGSPASAWNLPIPAGGGRFTVVGTGDNHAPALRTMTVTPERLTTSGAPQQVVVDIDATDVEGVRNLSLILRDAEHDVDLFWGTEGTLVSGTAKSGVWRFRVLVPGGTPPGLYTAQVIVEDLTHWVSYVSPSSPYATDPSQSVLTPTQLNGGSGAVLIE